MAGKSADAPYFHEAPHLDFQGARVIVLGGSPAVRPELDLQLDAFRAQGGLVVGVNHILRVYPRCDGVLFWDTPVAVEERERFLRYRGALLVGDTTWRSQPGLYLRDQADQVRLFALGTAASKDGPWPAKPGDPLSRQGTSPPWLIQLALLHGAAEINVLGVDHNAPTLREQGETTHCYQVEPRASGSPTGGMDLNGQRQAFYSRILADAQARGCALWNLSPYDGSPFTLRSGWPRRRLLDACP
jgi:hypothetical protein